MPDPKVLERLVPAGHARGAPAARRVLGAARPLRGRDRGGRSRWSFASRWATLAFVAAGAAPVLGAVPARCVGFVRKVTPAEAARLADRGFGFQDRVATALEWGEHPGAARRWSRRSWPTPWRGSRQRDGRRVIARLLPREAKLVPIPLALGLVLALAPPDPACPRGACPTSPRSRTTTRPSPPTARASSSPTSGTRGGQARRASARRPAGAHARAPPGRGRPHPGRRSRRRVQGHLAGRQEHRLQRLPEEGRRADPDARAGGPAPRPPARLHPEPEQGDVPAGQGAARRA